MLGEKYTTKSIPYDGSEVSNLNINNNFLMNSESSDTWHLEQPQAWSWTQNCILLKHIKQQQLLRSENVYTLKPSTV
jgi:hypothetical protein